MEIIINKNISFQHIPTNKKYENIDRDILLIKNSTTNKKIDDNNLISYEKKINLNENYSSQMLKEKKITNDEKENFDIKNNIITQVDENNFMEQLTNKLINHNEIKEENFSIGTPTKEITVNFDNLLNNLNLEIPFNVENINHPNNSLIEKSILNEINFINQENTHIDISLKKLKEKESMLFNYKLNSGNSNSLENLKDNFFNKNSFYNTKKDSIILSKRYENNILTDVERSSLFDKYFEINCIKKIQRAFKYYMINKYNLINIANEQNNLNINIAFKKFKTIDLSDGCIYKGQINENKKEGIGIIYDKLYTFIGNFKNDFSLGLGMMILNNGLEYFGNFDNLILKGSGKFRNKNNGTIFEGFFKENKQNGFGIEKWTSNSSFLGEYLNDFKNGIGILNFSDDSSYEGEFSNDDMNGIGKYFNKDSSNYFGEWKNNKMNGYGIYNWRNGNIFEGEFKEDLKNGFGILINKLNNKIYFGFWINDFLEGEGYIFEKKILKKYFFVKSKKLKALPDSYIIEFEKIVTDYISNEIDK